MECSDLVSGNVNCSDARRTLRRGIGLSDTFLQQELSAQPEVVERLLRDEDGAIARAARDRPGG